MIIYVLGQVNALWTCILAMLGWFFFFQAEDGIRDYVR